MLFSLPFACIYTPKSNNTNSMVHMTDLSIQSCDQSESLSADKKLALMEAGMTQCVMPFDILIAADEDMPSPYIELTATIVAEMVDADKDGLADDPRVLQQLQKGDIAFLAMPMEPYKWEQDQFPKIEGILGYDIIVPMWWMEQDTSATSPSIHARSVMVEEVTHLFTQFGWSSIYPAQFGVDNWESIIAQETRRAACTWWQHPENSCPNNPAEYEGDCSHPNCDVVEFYHQVLILRSGMQPAWFGIGFPQTQEDLESKLSEEIKQIMDDPQYHQRTFPLSFSYP